MGQQVQVPDWHRSPLGHTNGAKSATPFDLGEAGAWNPLPVVCHGSAAHETDCNAPLASVTQRQDALLGDLHGCSVADHLHRYSPPPPLKQCQLIWIQTWP